MPLVLELTDEQQKRLQRFAAANGLTEEKALAQLVESLPERPIKSLTPRVAGKVWMSPDFNGPLPDEFWFPNKQ